MMVTQDILDTKQLSRKNPILNTEHFIEMQYIDINLWHSI